MTDPLDRAGLNPDAGRKPITRNEIEETEQGLQRTFGVQLLDQAIQGLTEPQRVVFMLSELEQLSASEIAQALSLSLAAVVSRRRSARRAFQRFCDALNTPEEQFASWNSADLVHDH